MRFECKPEVRVARIRQCAGRAPSQVSERENLPDEVDPGVTYRNVAVRWRLAARLEDPETP